MPVDPQKVASEADKAAGFALPARFKFVGGPAGTVPLPMPASVGAGGKESAAPFKSGGTAVATAAPFPAGTASAQAVPAVAGVVPPGTRAPFSPAVAPAASSPSAFDSPRSSPSLSGRGFTRLAKLFVATCILLGGTFFFIRSVLPVLKELAHPEGQAPSATSVNPGAPVAKAEAPTGVQMIRQTREVVAKNDSKVAYLDAILAGDDPEAAAKPAARAAQPPAPKAKEPVVTINLKASSRFLEELPINGVMAGTNPRIVVNGLLVNVDDVVDWRLGLVFAGVDESARVLLFRHKDGTLLKRKY